MKKLILVVAAILLGLSGYSQVFNTGQTLKKGVFSLGLEPTMHIDGGANGLIFFLHAGYGFKSGIDGNIRIGAGSPSYFGADIEFALARRISLSVGAHNFGDFGLDGTFNAVIPIKSDVRLFTGIDSDIIFGKKLNNEGEEELDIKVPFWIPIGVEIELSKSVNLLFETEIGLNAPAYHVIGGGVNFYF
ncbi:MAG: hypothetical protein R6U66_01675 [Bacteroidales bacterium]